MPAGVRAGEKPRRRRHGQAGDRRLFEGTQVDAGGLLLLRRGAGPSAEALEVIASRTDTELPYYRVSSFLAATVLREGEAVLARNIMGDSSVSSRDSKGEIHATSVICAPIRRGRTIFGLIHLYSTNPSRNPDPDDLEFTLAVAGHRGRGAAELASPARVGREPGSDS